MRLVQNSLILILFVSAMGCGGLETSPSGAGGTTGSGGVIGTGGVVGSGGVIGSGGVTGTGGAIGSGGVLGSGGVIGSGGLIGAGGAFGSGGVLGSGGVVATGGQPDGGYVEGGSPDLEGEVGRDVALDSAGPFASDGPPEVGDMRGDMRGDMSGDMHGIDGSATDVPLPVGTSGCGSTAPPAACDTAATGPCTLNVRGITRQYFVVMPQNYDARRPTPVVFAWHYAGGTAKGLLPTGGGLALYGVQAGFPNAIYIVPQGLSYGLDGSIDYAWRNVDGQDLDFAKAMVAWVGSKFCVDATRIFATGMSYGGIMSETVACQMPDVFRAIGSIAGSLFDSAKDCLSLPIAAWLTHGDADTVVSISGDIAARDRLLAANGCNTTNTQSIALVDTIPNPDSNVTCTVYNQCTSGNYPVVWCPVPGGLHLTPSFAGAEIAKFFRQF